MPATSPNAYDPYSAWLNVKEKCRPLSAYQLLGLSPLEDDVDAIKGAAGLKRMAIEAHRRGAPPAVWDQVARELDQAIQILLDPEKKAVYDVALQTQGERYAAAHGSPFAVRGQENGGTVPCPECERPNPPVRGFCSHCGHQLWESCFDCGSLNQAVDRFCGSCGADLVRGAKEHTAEIEAVLAQAERARSEGRYEEAISLLGLVAGNSNSRFRRYTERAKETVRKYEEERDRWRAKLTETEEKARQHMGNHQYKAAAQLLEAIPRRFHSEPVQQLLDQAIASLDEVVALEKKLSSAVAGHDALRLLPDVSKLLALQPDHRAARRLAGQLRGRVLQFAEGKLANHEYRQARDLLDQLPEVARDHDVKALRERAAELAWLYDDLRHAPVVDATLVQVAQRLRSLAPEDSRAAKLLSEVRRREQIASGDPRRAYLPWVAPPARSQLGFPIDWLTGFQQIRFREDLAESILVAHPGCLMVACGLALQGLEQASVRLNLLPEESRTALGRLTAVLNEDPMSWVARKRPPRTAWGLDLSASGLKAVKLEWEGRERGVVIQDLDVVPHGKMIGEVQSDEQRKELVGETLNTFCSRQTVKADRICLGLPTRTLLTRRFTMPSVDPQKLEKAIAFEARRHIPIPLEEVVWDYQVMTKSDDDEESKRAQEILLIAAKRHQLVERLAALREARIRVDVIQSDCVALHNFLIYDRFGHDGSDDSAAGQPRPPVALLDVGCDQTQMVVSAPGSLWFRSTGFGGEQFTRALVRDLQLTAAQAEELKRNPARAESFHRMYNALEPALEMLAADARSMLDAQSTRRGAQRIERVLGCGGSFQLHGLLRYLRSGL